MALPRCLPKRETFLDSYKTLLAEKPESEATDATIQLMYRTYYVEMGGHGIAPDVRAQANGPTADNVTAFRRPAPQKARSPDGWFDRRTAPLPVGLIFICLAVVYVGIRYYWR